MAELVLLMLISSDGRSQFNIFENEVFNVVTSPAKIYQVAHKKENRKNDFLLQILLGEK